MWWAHSKLLEIYLGTTVVGLKSSKTGSSQWHAATSADHAFDVLESCLRQQSGTHPHSRVWLSAAYARPFVLPAESGVTTSAEAFALAESMAHEMTSHTTSVTVWLDHWHHDRACPTVAIPSALLEQLNSLHKKYFIHLKSVKPWWNAIFNYVRTPNSGRSRNLTTPLSWSLIEPDGLIFGTLKNGHATELGSCEPLIHDPSWEKTRQRLTLAAGENAWIWKGQAILNPSPHDASTINSKTNVQLPIGEVMATMYASTSFEENTSGS